MKREYKFRAWDGKRIDYDVNVRAFNDKYFKLNDIFAEDIIFMQYTGLKDKNGKEIYERDIVRFYFCGCCFGYADSENENGHHYTKMIDTVEFHDGAFYLMSKGFGGAYLYRHNKNCEVIGNMDENPELLA